jgi:SAM-dependent methyltransferase
VFHVAAKSGEKEFIMATSCPTGFDANGLRTEVARMYADLVSDPTGEFHFHRGPAYAVEFLEYLAEELAALPTETTAAFAGVGNPLSMGRIGEGETVVDVGCGAGTDLLIAAVQAGARGRAIGVDMTEAMRLQAMASARKMGFAHVEVRDGDAEALPVEDGVADVVISNGVINLTTDKVKAFEEVYRVLRPEGRLQLADIAVGEELPESVRNDIDLWAS